MTKDSDVVGRFFRYRAAQLQGLVDAAREIIDHRLTKGIEAENALRDLLTSLLPSRFVAGKGFIIDSDGHQSNEVDLIVLDQLNTARLFDFSAFELVPVEAAVACIEVKTTLNKGELDDTFERFQAIQDMTFHAEKMVRTRNAQPDGGAGVVATPTSRPELVLFAYDGSISGKAIQEAYDRHPDLAAAKVCILKKGIIVDVVHPPIGRRWVKPVAEGTDFSGRVLAIFLFQFLLPALFAQTKGQRFYVNYLEGESDFCELANV